MTDKQIELMSKFDKLCAYLDRPSEMVSYEHNGRTIVIDSLISGSPEKIAAWFKIMGNLDAEANADKEFAEMLLNYEYTK